MVDPGSFPPEVVVAVKSLACELPSRLGVPLSRLLCPTSARPPKSGASWPRSRARRSGVGSPKTPSSRGGTARGSSRATRTSRPRPPGSSTSTRVNGRESHWAKRDFVVSSDEKTSIEARVRRHESLGPAPGRTMRVEHEYKRGGSLQYLAAWDVHRAKVFGRCEPKTGIEPFGRLVDQVMTTEPYASARRVFWVVDNGSSHRGDSACQRMTKRWPNAQLVQLPDSRTSSWRFSDPPRSGASVEHFLAHHHKPSGEPSSSLHPGLTTVRPRPSGCGRRVCDPGSPSSAHVQSSAAPSGASRSK